MAHVLLTGTIRKVVLFWLSVSIAQLSTGQVTSYPVNQQLYPRDIQTNLASIPVAGTIDQSSGYSELRLKKYRNGILINTKIIPLSFTGGKAEFTVQENLVAELVNYRFDLMGFNGTAETLIRSAANVVAGDIYLIQGQSNAAANWRVYESWNDANSSENSPNRNFVRVWGGGSSTAGYTKEWFIANGNAWFETNGNTGQWALRMASNLAGSLNIPIAVLNGAHPQQRINFFQRNDANPTDIATNYGRLLTRTIEAGVKTKVRGIIWHQGESDVEGSLAGSAQLTTEQYKSAFLSLYDDWKTDYPGLNRIYLFQMRFGCGMISNSAALQVQEAQRQLASERPDISIMSTSNTSQLLESGTTGYCHFNFPEGYQLFGDWMSNLIKRDIYGISGPSTAIDAPSPSVAEFTGFSGTGAASQVTLKLKDAYATYILNGDLSGEFRLEGGSYTINSVSLSGNNVIIDFTRNSGTITNPTGLSYLGHSGGAAPVLANSNGIGLLYFLGFPINSSEPPPPPACTDLYETSGKNGAVIGVNNTIKALISSPSDIDKFQFKTDNRSRHIKISLFNLPADYDIKLQNSKGKLIRSSVNTGTTPEVIVYSGALKTGYRLEISGKNGAFNVSECYSLKVELSNTAWPINSTSATSTANNLSSPMEEVSVDKVQYNMDETILNIYPNPVLHQISISLQANGNEKTELRLIDITGRQVQVQKVKLQVGKNLVQMKVNDLTPGIYLLQVVQDKKLITRKLLISRR